jgi:hypothetical protein
MGGVRRGSGSGSRKTSFYQQSSFGSGSGSGRRLEHAHSMGMDMGDDSAGGGGTDFWPMDPSAYEDDTNPLLRQDYTVIIGLNLYKVSASRGPWVGGDGALTGGGCGPGGWLVREQVQQNIYLLDFQRNEGDAFSFMNLSARIITELKTLSAASRQVQGQGQGQAMMMQGGAVMGGASAMHMPGGPGHPHEGVQHQHHQAGGGHHQHHQQHG